MLNKEGQRELAYVVQIDGIKSIEGYDRVEQAIVGGWHVIVQKGQFKQGDAAVYFEVDSKVPATEQFAFLMKRKYRIKTLKMCGTISQGLLMSAEDFGWTNVPTGIEPACLVEGNGTPHYADDESRFLTKQLGVVYYVAEDNERKAKPTDSYVTMRQQHAKLFKNPIIKKMMRYAWFRMLMLHLFGKTKKAWPSWVKKTDQERVENMPWVLGDGKEYIVTEKCDGASATYAIKRRFFGWDFYVCSRNVVYDKPNKPCYFEDNYYLKMVDKYDIKNKMIDFMKQHKQLSWVYWQGEICGPKIQGNPHKLEDYHLYLFHMVDDKSNGRYDMYLLKQVADKYNMEHVPICEETVLLPNTMEEFKADADGHYSPKCCEGHTDCAREGYVYYSLSDPNFSFKNVSNAYLLSRHE